jgi:hypothetical protein
MRKENQQQWLREIDNDQNVQGINTLDDTQKDGAGKRWFPSQVIQPGIVLGHYNPSEGRYELVTPYYGEHTLVYDDTSASTYTLTAPAGHRYRVVWFAHFNITRASTITAQATIGGVTAAAFASSVSANTVAIGRWAVAVGGMSSGATNTSPMEVVLNPGDSITITDTTFVAADTVGNVALYWDEVIA